MTKLLVCIDGSIYADNICINAAWAAKRMNAEIDLLHVLRRSSYYEAPHDDHTGTLGVDARNELMEELTKVDEERGRLDQQKGRLILEHSEKVLKTAGVKTINLLYRRGSLSETIKEMEDNADMIFIGKRGEQANPESEFLGSNLEKVVRSIHKPMFVVSRFLRPIERFLIAYDGKDNANKAIDFIVTSPLLKGLEDAEFIVKVHNEKNDHIDQAIASYVTENNIDLLITGAYSHSRLRSLLLGSTTASVIKSCHIPLILIR